MYSPGLRLSNESAIHISSGALVALGVSVILGWHFDVARVVQLRPAFPPMQYNTALCFLLSGLATLYAGSRPRVSGTFAAAVVAIGVVSQFQYAVGRDFGIDELLMRAHITVETSHAGRMAPQTAIGFALAGFALLALTLLKPSLRNRLAAEIAASVLCGLGLAALIGYCVGVETAYGWGELTRIAAHTAAGFVVLGLAVLLNAWRSHSQHGARDLPPLAIPVATATLAVALSLFQALSQWQLERIDAATAHSVERAATVLENGLRRTMRSFGALTGEWGSAGGMPQRAWENDVARFLRDEKVFMAVSHGGADGTLDWIFPTAPFPEHVGFDYAANAARSPWLAAARERGGAVLTPPLALKSGRPGILLIAPLLPAIEGAAPHFAVAAALLEELFRPSADAIPGYRLAAFQGEQRVYGVVSESDEPASRSREIRLDGAELRLEATPLPETIAALRSPLPTVVLVSGLLASLLLALTAQAAQIASRRARELAAANDLLATKKKQLERLALFDELTGLGNRNLMLVEFDKALEAARRDSLPLALLVLDLNGFKAINDTFGHDAGDDVLQEFAARLTEALPLSAEAFRSGGDEFAVLTQPGTSLDEALAIAHQIERVGQPPILLDKEQRQIGASIGIAVYPAHGQDRTRLLRAADVAMYQAKRANAAIQVASNDSSTAVLRALQPGR